MNHRTALLLTILATACTVEVVDTDIDSDVETGTGLDTDTPFVLPPEVRIPAGSFAMGESGEERQITLTRAFHLQQTEVSQGDWDRLMLHNPSGTSAPSHPVERVSWYDTLAYANALSRQEGLPTCYDLSQCSGTPGIVGIGSAFLCSDKLTVDLACTGYRLPTEAEWEYAAHLGEGAEPPQCTGDADPDVIYCGGTGYTTQAVSAGQVSKVGLYGMQSNVGEWVWDWFDTYRGATTDPMGASSGTLRASRGGGWRFNYYQCRVSHRSSEYPSCQNDSLGFRLVRAVE